MARTKGRRDEKYLGQRRTRGVAARGADVVALPPPPPENVDDDTRGVENVGDTIRDGAENIGVGTRGVENVGVDIRDGAEKLGDDARGADGAENDGALYEGVDREGTYDDEPYEGDRWCSTSEGDER